MTVLTPANGAVVYVSRSRFTSASRNGAAASNARSGKTSSDGPASATAEPSRPVGSVPIRPPIEFPVSHLPITRIWL